MLPLGSFVAVRAALGFLAGQPLLQKFRIFVDALLGRTYRFRATRLHIGPEIDPGVPWTWQWEKRSR